MSKLTKSFMEAFARAVDSYSELTDGHKTQIDALQEFADALNAEGVFKAELSHMYPAAPKPVLKIERASDGKNMSFAIDYGFCAFGGHPTLQLTTGLGRKPLGDTQNGYDMTSSADREKLLGLIGEELAKVVSRKEVEALTVAYIQQKNQSRAP